MKKSEIIEKLSKKIAVEILSQPNRKISMDESLITSGLIDSFHLVDLALIVEDEFGVRIEDTELNSDYFNTITQLAEIIMKRLKNT
jgi:acyl carrier protein